ncbi:MAG: hypothetical protein KGL40_09770 [Rhodocyclaceae bacterium]|nr:hypothetical protein [Rhodocyclaceae bacterium]
MSIRTISGSTLAILLCGALYSLPAAAESAKPQLDVGKYTGAQKAQAEACNKTNTARAAISAAGEEIERLNTSINAAEHKVQDAAKGPDKDAAKAKVAELKAQRKAEQPKLKQAQADELAGAKEYRKAAKQGKKEKVEALDCI